MIIYDNNFFLYYFCFFFVLGDFDCGLSVFDIGFMELVVMIVVFYELMSMVIVDFCFIVRECSGFIGIFGIELRGGKGWSGGFVIVVWVVGVFGGFVLFELDGC